MNNVNCHGDPARGFGTYITIQAYQAQLPRQNYHVLTLHTLPNIPWSVLS